MNIYVVDFRDNYEEIDKNNLITANLSEIFESNSAEGGVGPGGYNIGNWWYDYRYVYSNGENHHYYRLKPNIGLKPIGGSSAGFKVDKGDVISVVNDAVRQKVDGAKQIIKYININETVNFILEEGQNHEQYDEGFKTGGWYRLGDIFYTSHDVPITYNTHDEIKVNGLQLSKMLIPKDEEKNVIDYSLKETKPWYYENIVNEPFNSPRFITEGIVTDYISFQWIDKYYDSGSFNLILPDSEINRNLFKENRFLLIGESDHCMMIEKVVFNNNLKSDGYIMEVTGRSLEAILERRIAFPGQCLSTNEFKGDNGLIKAIYNLIDGFFINPEKFAVESSDGQKFFYYPERRVEFLTIPDENAWYYDENNQNAKNIVRPFNESVNKTVMKDNLLKIISELCKNTYLGFRILPKPNVNGGIKWEFSLYTGRDKSYTRANKNDPLLLFSPKLGNVEAVSTTKDLTNYRNVIFCGVERDSDAYIDFTKFGNEANNFNQKTGIDIIDTINSSATSLVTGVKDRFVTMLESSPVCYTGIFFLSMAASRKDKDYTATVTKIESEDSNVSELYVEAAGYGHLKQIGIITEDGCFYLKGTFEQNSTPIVVTATVNTEDVEKINGKSFYRLILSNVSDDRTKFAFVNYAKKPEWGGGKYYITSAFGLDNPIANIDKNIDDKKVVYAEGDHSVDWNPIDPSIALCNYVGDYLDAGSDTNCAYDIYDSPQHQIGHCYGLTIRAVYRGNATLSLKSYPKSYITKAQAEKIKITYRKAFGEGEGASNKTDSFILVNVTDFKTSTQGGWLTTPILKQAINDINNVNFNILQRSALQAWFKTLDRYTDSSNQKRWLCQTYEYDNENIGINRREVFVEEDNSDSEEWNVSAINQFQASTAAISVNEDEDEETDEKINERLKESARKQSGNYRKKRDIDASLELESFEYMSEEQNGYNLGDIIQIDDGKGNQGQYIITGVTISNDTSSGLKRIPTFERFEMIPRQYRQLDYLQVANMILPAKFNRHFSGEQNAEGINLPPNVYFGSKRTDNGRDDPEIDTIQDIKNETIGVITDIECELEYVEKTDSTNTLSKCFAMISAIGSQGKSLSINPDTGNYDAYNEIKIPFALINHKFNGPYHFMTDMPDGSVSSNRSINVYFGIEASVIKNGDNIENVLYKNGDGYNRECLVERIDLGYRNFTIEPITGSDPAYFNGCQITGLEEHANEYIFKNNSNNELEKYLYLNNLTQKSKYYINRLKTYNPKFMYSNLNIPLNPSAKIKDWIVELQYYPNEDPRFSTSISAIGTDEFITSSDIINGLVLKYSPYIEEGYDYLTSFNFSLDLQHYPITVFINDQPLILYISGEEVSHACFTRSEENIHKFCIKTQHEGNTIEFDDFYVNVESNSDEIKSIHFSNIREENNKILAEVSVLLTNEDEYISADFMDYWNPISYSGGSIYPCTLGNEYTIDNKILYYTTSYSGGINENNLIHKKPLVNNFYFDEIKSSNSRSEYKNYLINEFCPINLYNHKGLILDGVRNSNNVLTQFLESNTPRSEYEPHIYNGIRNILINETGWGQDNYRMPKYMHDKEEPYSLAYNELLYENHIVLGGCGFYRYIEEGPENNFLLRFYNENVTTDVDELANIAPRACDAANGVRVYGTIKIYETVCSTRQIWFGNPGNDKICAYSNDNSTSIMDQNNDIKAYYPDLSTRKLVHEYVPVRYVEGDSTILKEEEYGFYDLIDKVFVPINWGNNVDATFIEAGGEINNE